MTNETTVTATTTASYLLRFEDAEHEIQADNLDAAKQEARKCARQGGYDTSYGTVWVDVQIHETVTDEDGDEAWLHVETITEAIHQPEPKCRAGAAHDWQSPHAIVGGIESNPGVVGHCGGVIITECCLHCGCRKQTDTWAQRRDTGEQGLTSVSYEPEFYELAPIYDDEHVIDSDDIQAADEAGACEEALEWMRDNVRGVTVAELRSYKIGWYDWARQHLGGLR